MLPVVIRLAFAHYDFTDIAMSHSGQFQIAVGTSQWASILHSEDSGSTWTTSSHQLFGGGGNTFAIPVEAASVSADGQDQIICGHFNGVDLVYESRNRGSSWDLVSFDFTVTCKDLAVDEAFDQKTILSSVGNVHAFVRWDATNQKYDFNFITKPDYEFTRIVMSNDGKYQLAIMTKKEEPDRRSDVWRSDDYAVSWNSVTNGLPTDTVFSDAAINEDGIIQYLVSDNGKILVSNDYGASFSVRRNDPSRIYKSVDVSGDGLALAALYYPTTSSTDAYYHREYPNPYKDDGSVIMETQQMTDSTTIATRGKPIKIAIVRELNTLSKHSYQMLISQGEGSSIRRSTTSGNVWDTQSLPPHPTPTPAPTPPPTPPPTPAPTPGPGSSGGNNNGAIIGGAVGGTVLIVLCGVSYYIKCGPFAQQSFANENLL